LNLEINPKIEERFRMVVGKTKGANKGALKEAIEEALLEWADKSDKK
jgi:hypothetical protein